MNSAVGTSAVLFAVTSTVLLAEPTMLMPLGLLLVFSATVYVSGIRLSTCTSFDTPFVIVIVTSATVWPFVPVMLNVYVPSARFFVASVTAAPFTVTFFFTFRLPTSCLEFLKTITSSA